MCCAENEQVWQNNAQRSLSPVSNGKSRSVDARPVVASPATGVKARTSTSESRDVASPVAQLDVNTSKPASMLNRFKLFNSRDRTSAGAGVKDVNGVHPLSLSQETSPAPKRQLPTYSSTQKGSGSQIPSYSTGKYPVDEHQLAQPMQSGPLRYDSAGIGSPGRPQRQRAPPPPERHASPGLQEPRRGRALPASPSSNQYAGEPGSTHGYGLGPESNRYPQQRAIQSRRNAERGTASNSREIFIDQPHGGDDAGAVYNGNRSSSSSVPSRTESSTSISSIASSSTTGGGVSSSRRSGLARRISSSAQPDKRNGKSVAASSVATATGNSSRMKSAKPLSSSIPAPSTPGSVSRAAARQLATPGETSTGSVRRQKGSASTTMNSDGTGTSVTSAETTSMERGGKASRGLIPRRNSSRTAQLVEKGEVDEMSPSGGRKLPTVANSRRPVTPDTDVKRSSTPSSEAGPVNRVLTADSSTNQESTSKPSRMPQPSFSAVSRLTAPRTSCSTSPPSTTPKLSAPATTSCDSPDVEQRRPVNISEDDKHLASPVTGGSVTAPSSPAISGPALMYRSASVGRPVKEKSNSSISSGFGDESNNSTSDSTDSVIFQPPSSSSTASRQTSSRVASSTASSTKNAMCESSSSAIDSDSPPSETTASKDVESSVADCAPASSPQSPPPTHQTVDHITSLRGSRRQLSDDVKSGAPVANSVSSPVDQCHTPTPGSNTSACETVTSPRTTELIDAFDGIKPMQPLVRSSIPCCVYEPSTRRLPTLLAQSTAGGPSRRLVFSRPPIGPGMVTAGGRGALGGRAGMRANGGESTAACGYMSDGDVVRGGGSGSAAVSRAADRLMSGYTSEGGGGVTSYARRMQQRFLEGILAVRQSMERTPQFTDDDRSDAFYLCLIDLNAFKLKCN